MTALIVGNETLKVKEITVVTLDDEKFKKRGSSIEGGIFTAVSSYRRSNSRGTIRKGIVDWARDYE